MGPVDHKQINTPDRPVGIADAVGCAMVLVFFIVLTLILNYFIPS